MIERKKCTTLNVITIGHKSIAVAVEELESQQVQGIRRAQEGLKSLELHKGDQPGENTTEKNLL